MNTYEAFLNEFKLLLASYDDHMSIEERGGKFSNYHGIRKKRRNGAKSKYERVLQLRAGYQVGQLDRQINIDLTKLAASSHINLNLYSMMIFSQKR